MTYNHATIYTAELDNYVLKIHGQGAHDMYIQVPTLKELELWNKRFNQRQNKSPSECSFLVKEALQSIHSNNINNNNNNNNGTIEKSSSVSQYNKKMDHKKHDDEYSEHEMNPISRSSSTSLQQQHHNMNRNNDNNNNKVLKQKDTISEATISNSFQNLNEAAYHHPLNSHSFSLGQHEENDNEEKEENDHHHQRRSSLYSSTLPSSPHSTTFS
ncbi:hypothetical protein BJ944DRAFT_20315 [Cunninghamella echinulata]|nr:hypothetical protein BJ944DRAFT_20315 [Cunninghamella echinulata]